MFAAVSVGGTAARIPGRAFSRASQPGVTSGVQLARGPASRSAGSGGSSRDTGEGGEAGDVSAGDGETPRRVEGAGAVGADGDGTAVGRDSTGAPASKLVDDDDDDGEVAGAVVVVLHEAADPPDAQAELASVTVTAPAATKARPVPPARAVPFPRARTWCPSRRSGVTASALRAPAHPRRRDARRSCAPLRRIKGIVGIEEV
jgi:hypothetical protein